MTKIKIKNSTTASGTPTSGTLLQGELAVNIADKRIYIGNASGNPIDLGGSITAVATGSVSGIYINTSTTPAVFSLQDNVFIAGTLQVSGVISTTETTGSLFNDTASRVNIGAGASGVLIGHATGVVTVGDLAVNDGTISTTATGVSIFDATALRVNIGGGASGVQIGHPTGTVVMGNVSANVYVSAASGYRITSAAINAQTATGYTLVSTDNGRIITFDSAATHTLRVPTGLDIGFNATIIQLGTGQVTCTGLSGATVNCYASGNKIIGQHGSASVLCYASNVYNLAGTLGI